MFGLSKLNAAVNHLAAHLTAQAETVGQVNAGVRGRLGLGGGEPARGLPAREIWDSYAATASQKVAPARGRSGRVLVRRA
jgi:hypothetical protein